MMKFKIGTSEKLDMLKFKNLGQEREKIIKSSYTDNVKFDYKLNNLVKIIHPKEIKVTVTNIINETLETKTFELKLGSISF